MKKIYLSLLSGLVALSVNAQLTQANHAPAAGDTYQMYHCDSVAINPGASGAGSVWNFSATTTYSNLIASFVTTTVNNTSYPAATVSVASSPINVSYYNSSSSALSYYGGNIAVGTIAANLNYTAPAVAAAYPMSLNTTSSSAIGGSINISSPLAISGTFSGTSNVLADGTGTMISAGGTFTDVIRVVTSQTISFTTMLASGTVTQKNYDFYSAAYKAPVFSITTSTVVTSLSAANSQTAVTRNKNAVGTTTTVVTNTTSINENVSKAINLQVYPNPSLNYVNFVTDSQDAKLIMVYDLTGKLVSQQLLNDGKVKLDVSDFNKGLYIYRTTTTDGKVLKAGKFTVGQ